MNKETFDNLPKKTKEFILNETFAQNEDGSLHAHSLQTIFAESRKCAIAARMLSKGCISVNGLAFSGKDIANVFIESVKLYKYTYFPLTGDWTNVSVQQLVLFVKENNRYEPYVRFNIEKTISDITVPSDFYNHSTVPDLLSAFKYKSLIKITAIEDDKLPKHYLGVTGAADVYEKAFHGSSPNILII